jgi:hypothetical protein
MNFSTRKLKQIAYFLLPNHLTDTPDKRLRFINSIIMPLFLLAFILFVHSFPANPLASCLLFALIALTTTTQLRYIDDLKNEQSLLAARNQILTEDKQQLEQQLTKIAQKNEELMRSEQRLRKMNGKLESFAYIANGEFNESLDVASGYAPF